MPLFNILGWCVRGSLVMAIASCSIDPHENFLKSQRSMVGTNMDRYGAYLTPENLLSKRQLPNGNVEYRYRLLARCIQILEVNPNSRVIEGAESVGGAQDCFIQP